MRKKVRLYDLYFFRWIPGKPDKSLSCDVYNPRCRGIQWQTCWFSGDHGITRKPQTGCAEHRLRKPKDINELQDIT